jgi:hypothetical protein
MAQQSHGALGAEEVVAEIQVNVISLRGPKSFHRIRMWMAMQLHALHCRRQSGSFTLGHCLA